MAFHNKIKDGTANGGRGRGRRQVDQSSMVSLAFLYSSMYRSGLSKSYAEKHMSFLHTNNRPFSTLSLHKNLKVFKKNQSVQTHSGQRNQAQYTIVGSNFAVLRTAHPPQSDR